MSSSSWALGPMCAWDTETTGTDPEQARIVTSAVVTIRPGEPKAVVEWLVDPGVQIPDAAAEIHGVTTEKARAAGVPAAGAVDAICEALAAAVVEGLPLVIFNAAYDLTLLDRECRRHDLATLEERTDRAGVGLFVVDPFVLDRKVDKYRKGKRTLGAVAAHYNVVLSEEEAHTAFGDCLATARVAYKLASTYPKVAAMPLPALHEFQKEAHFEWAEGFEQYLRRKDADAVVDRSWPMRPFGAKTAVAS
jgi:DNA polymerase III subunit epsilon